MVRLSKYRGMLVALALFFALFNVGLPIVLYACPMMAAGSCPMCETHSRPTGDEIRFPSRSCCVPVSVGERNSMEFEQSRRGPLEQIRTESSLVPLNVAPVVFSETPVASAQFRSPTPPSETDIPIFVSSLLI